MFSAYTHSREEESHPAFHNRNLAGRRPIGTDEIVGESRALKMVMQEVNLVAPTDSTVLILGETGTGKELIARAIHQRSNRSQGPFICVNCAAIPEALIASELFGHERGAFTGAMQRRVGRFEAANGGTIFLDEVGELPLETQVALLRVIQEREFERVGSSQPISVDVRIVAATNRELRASVEEGSFRMDLFYRLNVFPVQLPPLRDRVEDIPLLVAHLVEHYSKRLGKTIQSVSPKSIEMLQAYSWPGNIRELQNVVERSVVLCEGDTLSVDDAWLKKESMSRMLQSSAASGPFVSTLVDGERKMIEAALEESRGRISGPTGAAAKLGIPRQTLDSKIAGLGIDKRRFKLQSAS